MPAEPLKPSHSAGMFSLSLGAEPVYRLGPLRGEAELGEREVELASLPELTLLGDPALDILFAYSEVGEGCGPQFYKGAPVGLGIELDGREIVGTHVEIAETGLASPRREGPGQRLVGGVSVPGGVDALPALAIGVCIESVPQSTSQISVRPPGLIARKISRRAAVASGTYSSTWTLNPASKLASSTGSDS